MHNKHMLASNYTYVWAVGIYVYNIYYIAFIRSPFHIKHIMNQREIKIIINIKNCAGYLRRSQLNSFK